MLSYGSDFSVWFDSIFLAFRVGDKSYSVSTSEQVFHVVFTLSTVNGPRCYINGTHMSWKSNFSSGPPSPRERKLSIAIREDYKITELFLWSSEMTPKQVLEEYEGRNFMFFIYLSHFVVFFRVTHVKKLLQIFKQVVTRLLLSRYQDVFALLVSSCCDKSKTSCCHLVARLMTLTDLLQVGSNKTNTDCLYQVVQTVCIRRP